MGSTSSIVISFSIAILLLLVLLLLISYNSKCNVDKVERFEGAPEQIFNMRGGGGDSYYSNEGFADMLSDKQRFDEQVKLNSVATKDSYLNMGEQELKASSIAPYSNDEYQSSSTITDSFENPSNDISQDPTSCFKRDRLTKDDLLPKDANLKWATINPSSAGDISDKNFLTAGYHMGVNTVGQSLRNANLQLRSEIPNPQVAVSPWMISTIEPDVRPVTFEIGSTPSY